MIPFLLIILKIKMMNKIETIKFKNKITINEKKIEI